MTKWLSTEGPVALDYAHDLLTLHKMGRASKDNLANTLEAVVKYADQLEAEAAERKFKQELFGEGNNG